MPGDIPFNFDDFSSHFLQEFTEQASDAERDLQLHYAKISVLWEEQKRLAELDPPQLESEWMFHQDSERRRRGKKGKLLDVRWGIKKWSASDFTRQFRNSQIHNTTTCLRTETTDGVVGWSDLIAQDRISRRCSVTHMETLHHVESSRSQLIKLTSRAMTQSRSLMIYHITRF